MLLSRCVSWEVGNALENYVLKHLRLVNQTLFSRSLLSKVFYLQG